MTLAVAAMALAAKRIEGLQGEFLGDGPERAALDAAISAHELQGVVTARGFTDAETVDAEMRRAMCMLVTSRREGYGLVVVEAAAQRNAERRRRRRGQRGDRAGRRGRQRLHRRELGPRVDRRGDRARARGRDRAAREHRALVRGERRAAVAGVLAAQGAGELLILRLEPGVANRRLRSQIATSNRRARAVTLVTGQGGDVLEILLAPRGQLHPDQIIEVDERRDCSPTLAVTARARDTGQLTCEADSCRQPCIAFA